VHKNFRLDEPVLLEGEEDTVIGTRLIVALKHSISELLLVERCPSLKRP